jgi:hypothetical protein
VIVKPAVVLLAIASCVPGCQLVFPLASTVDKVPHVPEDQNEEPGLGDFVAPPNFSSYDTTMAMQAFPGVAEFEKIKQDGADLDVVVMRVGTLTIGAGSTFRISGDTAFLVIARTIQIDGTLDASAFPDGEPAPGGGRPGMGDAGEGSAGLTGGDRINTGGGGGGMASGAGAGGTAACLAGIPGGAGGSEVGDAELNILVGGGAGGIGGQRCAGARPRGGFGGGALQLSATESITISASGRVIASGGGGGGGAGADACPQQDDAGSGGGAGGAIFLDAPRIANEGSIEAHGGGGGGGGGDKSVPDLNGLDGQQGHFGNETVAVAPELEPRPSGGGAGREKKGTFGGNGARGELPATTGEGGDCMLGQTTFNTGGGGGAFGRIVVRVAGDVSPFGDITPPPRKVAYPAP